MNRDKKLGLALGVLLVGIVAAFFFRNEPNGGPEPPLLENPKPLNDRIAERPAVPYLTGDDSERRTPPRRRPAPTTVREDQDAGDREWSVRFEDELNEDRAANVLSSHQLARNDSPSSGRRPPPQPIPLAPESDRAEAPGASEHNREWSTDAPSRAASTSRSGGSSRSNVSTGLSRSDASASDDAEWIMHDVRPGETLSGLALKYLGSQHRYEEILEANRDRLRTPKELRSGMKIRIPKKSTSDRTAIRESGDRHAKGRDGAGRQAAERDRDQSANGDRPIAPAPKRAAKDQFNRSATPKASAPTRTVTSRDLVDDDQPFGADEPSPSGKGASSAGHNPFLPSTDPNTAPREAAPPRSLTQRRPEDLPAPGVVDGARSKGGLEPAQRFRMSEPEPPPVAPVTRVPAPSREPFAPRPAGATSPSATSTEPLRPAARTARAAAPADRLAPGRYLVQNGDTLERIARRLYGDPNATSRILEANPDLLGSADDLREGMSLRIPLP